ncbi:hypothetical protein EhV145_00398 [Emiliania huxleyi virus 145]|nr:hypothetical protein EhV145_00398 [Emiliania huxleyi virus 145]
MKNVPTPVIIVANINPMVLPIKSRVLRASASSVSSNSVSSVEILPSNLSLCPSSITTSPSNVRISAFSATQLEFSQIGHPTTPSLSIIPESLVVK